MSVILSFLWANRRWVIYGLVAVAVVLVFLRFSHARFEAGREAGRTEIKQAWDADRLIQQQEYDDAAQAALAKQEHDRKAAEEIENGLREQIQAASDSGAALSQRVRQYQASLARCRALPTAPTGAADAPGAIGDPRRDEGFERLSDSAWSACQRDAVRLDAIHKWAAEVGLEVAP